MNLFMHLDPVGQLNTGDIITPQRHTNSCRLSVFADMFCQGFISHLNDLCREGLSYHGISYLYRNLEPNHTFRTDLILQELNLEYVRWKNNINEPSRLQSLFAWENKEDALKFAKENKAYPTIYEVEALGRFFMADMDLSRRPDSALKYWHGKPLCNDDNYKQTWECVLELPVRIIRQMKLIPTFEFAEE